MAPRYSDAISRSLERSFQRFIERVQSNEPNEAAEEFGRMCRQLRSSELKLSSRVLASFAEGWIDLFWQCRQYESMLKATREARKLFGDDPEWAFAEGEALFNLGRFEESWGTLEPLTHEDFDEPMLYYLLACMAERRGEQDMARSLFKTASRIAPSGFDTPLDLSESDIVVLYERCLTDLPDPIHWHLKSVPVEVADLPPDDIILAPDPPLDPLTPGIFVCIPNGPREANRRQRTEPRVVLFRRNIAKLAVDFEVLEDDLRRTLFHDVGHYLGYDEDQLEEMGLG